MKNISLTQTSRFTTAAKLGVATLALSALIPLGSASATLNHPYDGTDPSTTGCTAGAKVVASTSVDGGTLQLLWSPRCLTNWARFFGGNVGSVAVWVHRNADNQFCGDQSGNGCDQSPWWPNSAYSNQLYGCNLAAYAEVEILNSPNKPIYGFTKSVGGC